MKLSHIFFTCVVVVCASFWNVHAGLLDTVSQKSTSSSGSSASTSESLGDPDHDGLNTFSQAYNNNEQQIQRLLDPAFEDLYKKLSWVFLADGRLKELREQCDNCEYILKPTLDSAIREYVRENFELFVQYGASNAFQENLGTLIIANYFEDGIVSFDQEQAKLIGSLSQDAVLSITDQIRWKNDVFEAFGATGLDADGVESTSSTSPSDSVLAQIGFFGSLLAVGSPVSGGTSQPNDDITRGISSVFKRIICNPSSETNGFINFFHDSGAQQENPMREGRGADTGVINDRDKDSIRMEFQENASAIRGGFYNQYCRGKETFETLNRDFLHYANAEVDKKNLDCMRANPMHLFETQPSQIQMFMNKLPNTSTGGIAHLATQPSKRLAGSVYDTKKAPRKTQWEEMKETLRTTRSIAQGYGIQDFPGNAAFLINQGDLFGDLNLSHSGNIGAVNNRFAENVGEQDSLQQSKPTFDIIAEEISRQEQLHLEAQYKEIESYAISQFKNALYRENTLKYLSNKPECG